MSNTPPTKVKGSTRPPRPVDDEDDDCGKPRRLDGIERDSEGHPIRACRDCGDSFISKNDGQLCRNCVRPKKAAAERKPWSRT